MLHIYKLGLLLQLTSYYNQLLSLTFTLPLSSSGDSTVRVEVMELFIIDTRVNIREEWHNATLVVLSVEGEKLLITLLVLHVEVTTQLIVVPPLLVHLYEAALLEHT